MTDTLCDSIIPYIYWFENGFGKLSLPMAIANMVLIIITVITVKGIEFSLLYVPPIILVVVAGCVAVGWFLERYSINSRIATHVTKNQNPMLNEMYEDIKSIKLKLGGP